MLFDNNGNLTNDTMVDEKAAQYIMEAAMMDVLSTEEISMFLESQEEVDTALAENVLMEKTIVKLDKHAKLSRARKQAIFTIAKEKNDPKFKKLLTIWKMERYLENELEKKYGSEATRRAKKAMTQKADKSNSAVIKKVADKAKGMLNSK